MKSIIFSVGIIVLALGGAILAQTPTQSAEQELIKLENEWADAVVRNDSAFHDRILADDYTGTDADGSIYTKAQEIAVLKSGELEITSCVHHELKVRVYGDAAVVTGLSTTKGTYKGKEFDWRLRWTDTWVKLTGHWQCVAEHSSLAPQK
jgi:ketosteroid isomerase-like protein